ncbi:MAG: metal-sensing transcriptional repressor [Candidatus Moraniibacteriota bacterium]|nr:MAG: metal-sensing transcriptional repressor [Candidatus Moranbacteria bacterium]
MDQKAKISIALKKARTSLEKILAAIDTRDTDCFPIIQQNLAVIGLLKSANLLMLESHMERTAQKLSGNQAKQLRALHKELLKIVNTAQSK